jgi:hypothetical protein
MTKTTKFDHLTNNLDRALLTLLEDTNLDGGTRLARYKQLLPSVPMKGKGDNKEGEGKKEQVTTPPHLTGELGMLIEKKLNHLRWNSQYRITGNGDDPLFNTNIRELVTELSTVRSNLSDAAKNLLDLLLAATDGRIDRRLIPSLPSEATKPPTSAAPTTAQQKRVSFAKTVTTKSAVFTQRGDRFTIPRLWKR